ncbi:hypothetical protein L7F22_014775 [Adiantum nelumboides]|nr:hypothetical protein [Adiantum nelumboides]
MRWLSKAKYLFPICSGKLANRIMSEMKKLTNDTLGSFMLSFQQPTRSPIEVQVKYVTLPGWEGDISTATSFEQLPENCRAYVEFIEKFLGVHIEWIGVGPGRESMITR